MFVYDNQKWLEEAERCYPGWWSRIQVLDKQLQYLLPDYKIIQIKEKFGTLRFYANVEAEDEMKRSIAYSLIAATEYATHWICEKCGQYGESRDENWIRVLCDQHYQELLDAKNKE